LVTNRCVSLPPHSEPYRGAATGQDEGKPGIPRILLKDLGGLRRFKWHEQIRTECPSEHADLFYMNTILTTRTSSLCLALAFTLITGGQALLLASAPVVLTQPISTNAAAGGGGRFSVTATGTAPLQYQWRLNGTNLHSGGAFAGATSNILSLTDVRNYHAGSYDVLVSNNGGTVTSAPAALVLTPINWPGHRPHRQVESICFTNGRAYLTSVLDSEVMSILNISDPRNCVELGYWSVPGWAGGVAARGQYAYLQAGTALQVLDISNPANPFLAGTFPVGGSFAFSSNYLCVAAGTNLLMLSAANPTNLVQVGQLPVSANKVIVDGRYAYAISSSIASSPVTVIDIQDPANPQKASWYDLSGWTGGIAKKGNYLFVANDNSDLLILDVSTPLNPKFVSNIYLDSFPRDVAIYGNYALVACYWWGLSVVDVTDPTHPKEVAFYETATPYTSADGMITSVAVDGHYAYLGTDYGLQVLDLTDPRNPMRVGGELSISDVAIQGNTAFLIDRLSGLQVVDITNPSHPTQLGAYDFINYVRAVTASGQYAFVAEDNALNVMDVSVPSNPIRRGSCAIPAGGYNVDLEYDIVVRSNRVFVGSGLGGLTMVDVSNPSTPTMVGHWTNSSLGVALDSSYAYVATGNPYWSGNRGLDILNIANPGNPTRLSEWDTSVGYAYRVAANGNYAYLADGASGVQVFDITDRSAPFRVANYAMTANDLVLRDNRAYVTGNGLRILDLGNPASPTETLRVTTPGGGSAVAISGNYALIADGQWGLAVVQLPTPPLLSNTRLVAGTNLVFTASGGLPLGNVYVVTSTNLAVPTANWAYWKTNSFDAKGNATVTNALKPGEPKRFFRLRLN
jgi:hypothetical protein